MQRSATQPSGAGRSARPGGLFNRPGGLFGGGLLGGLAAGFLGAGLFGLLFGSGLFGGLGGFASILGLLIQVALVVIVARLIWSWWQRRTAAGLRRRPGYGRQPMLRDVDDEFRRRRWPARRQPSGPSDQIGIVPGRLRHVRASAR